MSGHSKWSTIKRKKGATDAKRSKEFTRVIKAITVAVKSGGGPDREANPSLRVAIANAKGVNMPKDNIERAISKASDKDSASLSEVSYEGYGPNGVALFVDCTTDNLKRTVSNIRSIFTHGGGTLGTNGSLEFIFERKGVFTLPAAELDEEELTLDLIDGGAEDVVKEEDVFIVYTSFEDFGTMHKKLEELSIEPENAEVQRIPTTTKGLSVSESKQILRLVEKFEDDEDVQNVYHNLEISEALINELD
ncbi:MAG: YebC/PmpR family DNA-binding transcriptional regulator [Flavobacteriales bacterium]|nr:YebC/PmpR family DNA-binding transcriptional regulator [Flavobacteriales bacterium]